MRSVLRFALLLAAVGATALGAQAATPGIPAFYVDYQQNCTFSMSVDPGTALLPGSSGADGAAGDVPAADLDAEPERGLLAVLEAGVHAHRRRA